jgi:DNA-binding XRE family transcriptional regulator
MITKDHTPSESYVFLTPQKQQAVDLMVLGKKQRDIAREVGVERETISRWKDNPQFKKILTLRQMMQREKALTRLSALYNEALSKIESALKEAVATDPELQVALVLLKTIDPYKNLSLDVEEDTIFVREESSQQQEQSKDELLGDSGITLVPELANQRQHISQASNRLLVTD